MCNLLLFIDKLPSALQKFLDSEIVILLFAVCLILIVVIVIVAARFYYETKEINQMLTFRAMKWANKSPGDDEADSGKTPKKDDLQIKIPFEDDPEDAATIK